jgi:hypothetical protein
MIKDKSIGIYTIDGTGSMLVSGVELGDLPSLNHKHEDVIPSALQVLKLDFYAFDTPGLPLHEPYVAPTWMLPIALNDYWSV